MSTERDQITCFIRGPQWLCFNDRCSLHCLLQTRPSARCLPCLNSDNCPLLCSVNTHCTDEETETQSGHTSMRWNWASRYNHVTCSPFLRAGVHSPPYNTLCAEMLKGGPWSFTRSSLGGPLLTCMVLSRKQCLALGKTIEGTVIVTGH